MTTAKTRRQIEDKKHRFMKSLFPDGYANKTEDDFIRRAWMDTFRVQENMLCPFFAANAPSQSRTRITVQCHIKNKTKNIAERMQADGGDAPGITGGCTSLRGDTAHIVRISGLCDTINAACGRYLRGGKLKFGRAQKILNGYLKYLWCAGRINTPPHCPFDDRVILRALPKRDDKFWLKYGGLGFLERRQKHIRLWHWSQSDSLYDYQIWTAASAEMQKRANFDNIAEWELFVNDN